MVLLLVQMVLIVLLVLPVVEEAVLEEILDTMDHGQEYIGLVVRGVVLDLYLSNIGREDMFGLIALLVLEK